MLPVGGINKTLPSEQEQFRTAAQSCALDDGDDELEATLHTDYQKLDGDGDGMCAVQGYLQKKNGDAESCIHAKV